MNWGNIRTVLLVVVLAVVTSQFMDWNSARTVALITCAVTQTAFVVFYLTFPWFRSFLGRALFSKALALMVIVDFAALSRYFEFGDNDKMFTVLYWCLTLGVIAQFRAFIRVKREGREHEVSGNR